MSDKYNEIMHQKEIKGVSLSGWMHRALGVRLGGIAENILKRIIGN